MLVHEADTVITPTLAATGEWEPGETANMRDVLRPGMTVVDVGAHCGWFTILAARLVGPSGRVVAFEPHPRSYELLLLNAWRNGLDNVTAFPWAVSEDMAEATLHEAGGNTGDHRIVETEDPRPTLGVRTVPLDALIPRLAPVDFLKIDTQGCERRVLEGAGTLLRESPDVTMVVEFWPFGLRRAGDEPAALIGLLERHGFRIHELKPNGLASRDFDLEEVLARCAREGWSAHTNLLLTR